MSIPFIGGDLSGMDCTSGCGELQGVVFSGNVPFTGLGVRVEGVAEYAATPDWTALQDVWLHFMIRNALGANQDICYFMDGAVAAYKLHTGANGTTLRFSYFTAPSTWTQLGTDFTILGDWPMLDIHLVTGASGNVEVFLEGVGRMPLASASMTENPDITSVRVVGVGGGLRDFGGMVVATEPTIGWRVGRLVPSGAGANTAWVGDYVSVDETTLVETDYIYSGTANQVETFTVTLSPAITGYVPRAVAVSARARRGASGPANIQMALRSGSTDYFSSSLSLGLGYTGNFNIWTTNPDTSAAWVSTQISALQIGVKSIT